MLASSAGPAQQNISQSRTPPCSSSSTCSSQVGASRRPGWEAWGKGQLKIQVHSQQTVWRASNRLHTPVCAVPATLDLLGHSTSVTATYWLALDILLVYLGTDMHPSCPRPAALLCFRATKQTLLHCSEPGASQLRAPQNCGSPQLQGPRPFSWSLLAPICSCPSAHAPLSGQKSVATLLARRRS